jgi:hypothetical protein
MAKKNKGEAKAEKPAKNEDKAEKAAEREFKFGVEDLAEAMGVKPASVRVQLRNHSIQKAGKSYGWNTKKELEEVMASIKSEKPAKADKPKKGEDAEGAAEKGGKGKKNKGKKNK